MKKINVLSALFCLTIGGGYFNSASASLITQVNSVDGLGDQANFTLENFEDNQFATGIQFSSSTGTYRAPADVFSGSNTPSGKYGLTTNSYPDPISMTFTNPITALGLFFGNDDTCCTNNFTAYLDIFTNTGEIETISAEANMNDWTDQFIGFVSETLITKVVFRYGYNGNEPLHIFLDDVRFSAKVESIPLPGTLGLTLLAGLGLLRRKTIS
ncbi:hypothetical protein H0A36_18290 [Endozoicomonas sp. SM1973]|uniref:PEP-CTERM protein-sorting domain-containing protein n=1 Tax=Spartinivicinus marinus TaxID=2994442 RepID=A0A853I5I2_9GAMM|nr:hypothetical protein [Spartinivicinus marinus]MCX4027271.1 hypothetical protein [Spartinivicinus marinus]NYZ67969.1 hypothetical protein [Spartinivicinus marinus]